MRPGLALVLVLGVLGRPALGADPHGGGHEAGGHAAAPAAPIEPLPVAPYSVPVELVRTLQLLQDRIAQGSAPALTGQRALLAHAEQRMLELAPEIWADPAALRAAVTFALGGGGPPLLRHIMATGKVSEAETPLVLGALAYASRLCLTMM